jgi:uncharacterized protein (DUF2147 family)
MKARALGLTFALAGLAHAEPNTSPHHIQGWWWTADRAAVIEFKPCSEAPQAVCGEIVWDKDQGSPTDACNVRIAKLRRWESGAWRDGWAYDPRTRKHYKAIARATAEVLQLRAYVGTELFGETEALQRTVEPANRCPLR